MVSAIGLRRAVRCAVVCLLIAGAGTRAVARAADPYDAEIVQTSGDLSQRLARQPDAEFGAISGAAHLPVINVNAGVPFQTVKGFGAAMTDTSAWLMEREIAPATRSQLFGELFGAGGIHLNFVRVPMGASDFTRTGVPYTYDDMPAGQSDPRLRRFSIGRDRAYIIPALRQALAANPQTAFLASPWTAPAWMKGNRSLGNAGNLGTLRGSAYRPWAEYFVRFLQAYRAAGVPIGALTVQNEPGTPTLYPGMNLSAAAESNLIVQDLRPALAGAGLHPAIYGGDLGWGPNNNGYMSSSIFGAAGGSLTGLSWHCYYGAPGVMNEFRHADPRLDEIVDECSPGGTSPTPTSEIVIASLRDWASTVALWNLALDPHGGPVQVPNHGCPACVGLASIDEHTAHVGLTRSYYQLGQASAFITPGARRIASNHFVSYAYPHKGVSVVTPGLDDVAFRNPDGSVVLVAYDNAPQPARFAVAWRGRALPYALGPGSMVTMVFNRP
ncbi:MAG: glycoside hydrolase family 30 beta sandwich domain-containing protein [Solirubrobacteraceae bacterium]